MFLCSLSVQNAHLFFHFTVDIGILFVHAQVIQVTSLLAIHKVSCGSSQPTSANRWEAWCKGNGMFECTFLVNKCTQIGLGNSKHVMRIPDCKPIKFNYICYALQCPFKKKKVIEEAQLLILSSISHCSSNCSTPHWRWSGASDSSTLIGFSSTTSSKQPPYSVKERIYSSMFTAKPMIFVLVCIASSFSPDLVRI